MRDQLITLATGILLARQLPGIVAVVGVLLFPGCRCSSDQTDEERLKKKIDSAVVHIYVGTRVTIAESGKDANSRAVREELAKWLARLGATDGPKGTSTKGLQMDWSDFGTMAKQIPQLKALGGRVVRGESAEKNPVLPGLLKIMQVESPLTSEVDLETDHGIFYMTLSALAAYGVAPVPKKVLLYEAWRTKPEMFEYQAFRLPLHALKSWTYGSSNFCDLSLKEAQTTEKISVDAEQFLNALKNFGIETDSDATDSDAIEGPAVEHSLRAIAFGSVSWCHIARGNDKEARPYLRRFIDHAKKTELGPDETTFEAMEVYYLCGGEDESVEAGKTKLAQLIQSKSLSTESHDVLFAWCDAADESDSDTVRRLIFSGALVQLMAAGFGEWLTEEKLKELPITESVEGMTELLKKAEGLTGNVADKVKGWNPLEGEDTGE